MKKVYFLILLVVILGACGQQTNNNSENASFEESDEGVIVDVKKDTSDKSYILLTLPSEENIDFTDKTRDELIKLAQENDGVFYDVSEEKYEELGLEIGVTIVGYYDGEGESDPPVRFTDKIEVISQ